MFRGVPGTEAIPTQQEVRTADDVAVPVSQTLTY